VRHGLITEEIPAKSHIYGSAWYLAKVAKYGEPPLEWLNEARAAVQEEAALVARLAAPAAPAAPPPAPAQSDGATTVEMKAPVTKLKRKSKKDLSTKGTLLTSFAPIKVLYEESETAPVRVNTDSMNIKKAIIDHAEVWVTDDGFVYDTNSKGKWGKLIGNMHDGVFVGL